jgi:hypothetical protein
MHSVGARSGVVPHTNAERCVGRRAVPAPAYAARALRAAGARRASAGGGRAARGAGVAARAGPGPESAGRAAPLDFDFSTFGLVVSREYAVTLQRDEPLGAGG